MNPQDSELADEAKPLLGDTWNQEEGRLLISFFLVIFGLISGTYYWGALLPAFEKDPLMDWTPRYTSWILTLAGAAEMSGLLLAGPLADCIPAPILLTFQAVSLCVILLAVSICAHPWLIVCLTMAGAFIKGIMWPSLGTIISANLSPEKHDVTFALSALASRIGDACTSVFLGLLMESMGLQWRHAVTVLLVILMVMFACAYTLRPRICVAPRDNAIAVGDQLHKWRRLITSVDAWLTLFVALGAYTVWVLSAYLPVLISDVYGLSVGVAAASSSILPMGSVLGLLFCGFTSSTSNMNGARSMQLFQGSIASIALGLLAVYRMSFNSALLLIGIVGFSFVVPAYLPWLIFGVSSLPEERAFRLATIDGLCAAVSVFLTYAYGTAREQLGSAAAAPFLFGFASASMVMSCSLMAVLYWRLRRDEPIQLMNIGARQARCDCCVRR